MILLLAVRNIFRHTKQTLLLVFLIAFISSVFFLGNSVINQSNEGLRNTYVENLTADLMIQKTSEISMSLYGANTPVIEDFFKIPVLPVYDDVRNTVAQFEEVDSSAAIVSGKAVMDVLDIREAVALTGVEAPEYFDLFPGIRIEDGRVLSANEEGVMMTLDKVRSLEKQSGKSLPVGSPVKFTMAYGSGFKIREVPLVGIYSYENPGPYMQYVILCDPQTVRALSSVLKPASTSSDISDESVDLFSDDDLDDLFGGDADSFVSQDSVESNSILGDLEQELNETSLEDQGNWVGGDWNFILVRLKQSNDASKLQAALNERLTESEISIVGWRTAAGNTALVVLMIQAFFYGGVFLAVIAGIISIVNIVLISVFKRTKEIGTLRAIGASDLYINSLVLFENIIISLFAGLFGVFIGYMIMFFLNSLEIGIANQILSSLLGQKVLNIRFQAFEAVKALALSFSLGVLSSVYPAWRAVLIHPIEAVRRG